MGRDLNRRAMVMQGQAPASMEVGTTYGPLRPDKPPLSSLRRRGVAGRDKGFQRADVDLSVARVVGLSAVDGGPKRFGLAGNVLTCMRSTFPVDELEVRFDGAGPWVPMGPGSAIEGQPFTFVEVVNTAQPGSVVVLIAATDYPGDRLFFRYR